MHRDARGHPSLAGIRAGGIDPSDLPEGDGLQWREHSSRSCLRSVVRRTVAGAAQFRMCRGLGGRGALFCFPFNCAGKNTGAGTNAAIVAERAPTIAMSPPRRQPLPMATVEDLAERVERLLLRHDELKRTAALLEQELAGVTQERDSLRSRLNAARSRIDALLARLPADAPLDGDASAVKGANP